jgi:hypothetical protein
MSADNFTVGTETVSTIDNDGAIQWCAYDPSSERVVVIAGRGSVAGGKYGVFSNNGTTLTEISTAAFDHTSDNSGTDSYWAQRGGITKTSLTSLTNNPIVVAMHINVTGQSFAGAFSVAQNPVTNFDNNYIGLASTTASDGQNVDINLTNSINTSQSGLTIGDDYFSNGAGEINPFIKSATTTHTYATGTVAALTNVRAAASNKIDIIYDTHNDKVWAYCKDGDNSNYPTVIVGDISSGTSITWGTPVTVTSNTYSPTAKISQRNIASDGSGNILVAYRDNSNDYARVKVGNYSATNSATFGNELQPENISALNSFDIGYCSSSNLWYMFHGNSTSTKWALMKQNSGNQNFDSWDVGTIYTGDAIIINNVYNSTNNKIILPLNQSSNGRFFVCDISADGTTNTGYTLNKGTEQTITLSGSHNSDGRSKLILDTTNNNYILLDSENVTGMNCSVITESSGSLSQSTPQNVSTGTMASNTAFYNPSDQKFYGAYQVYSSPYANKNYLLTVSGTTFTYVDGIDMPNATDRGVWSQGIYIADITKGVFIGQTNNGYDMVTAIMNIGSSTTYTQTDTQYIGEAISTTSLLLKDTPTDIIFGKASTTIAKGNPVIVEADGDFAKVTSTGGNNAEISAVAFTDTNLGGYGNTQSATSDGKGIIAVAYKNVSPSHSYPTVTLGSMATNGTITWGSERILMSGVVDSENLSVAYAPNYNSDAGGFYMSAYRASNTRQVNWSITYSGTTSTYAGDSAILSLSSSHNGFNSSTFDTTNNKAHVLMLKPYSAMYTISNTSGTTISASSLNYVISGSASSNIEKGNVSYDNTNNTGVIVFRDEGNNDYPTAIAYTISGNTFTFGSKTVIESSSCYYIDVQADTGTNKTVVAWGTLTTGATIKYVTLDYSGTTITVNTVTTISGYTNHTMNQNNSFLTYSSVSQQFYLAFNRNDLNYILLEGAVNSSDNKLIDWTEKVNRGDTNHNNAFTTYSGKNNLMMLGSYHSNELWSSSYGGAYSDLDSNLTTENFIGFSENAVSANEASKVKVNGIDANQTGLTAGQLYYVKNDATISEIAETGKVVEAGKAISATQLLVKG